MPYICSQCGKTHEELGRFFMHNVPENSEGKVLAVKFDRRTMCRDETGRCFVQCELEIPLVDRPKDVLGFIVWVEVGVADYQRLLAFWEADRPEAVIPELFHGRLANPITCVPGSYGEAVKFKVLANDPTPYIRWIAPGILAKQVEAGASQELWHRVHESVSGRVAGA